MSTTTRAARDCRQGLEKFADDLDAKGTRPAARTSPSSRTAWPRSRSLKEQVKDEAEAKGEMATPRRSSSRSAAAREAKTSGSPSPSPACRWTPRARPSASCSPSPTAYSDFVGRYAKNGVIPNAVKGVQSNPFQADLKALLTGASSTSAGARPQRPVRPDHRPRRRARAHVATSSPRARPPATRSSTSGSRQDQQRRPGR
jgi:hypothetical protein